MIPAKSSNYDLPDSYDNIEQTLITADQILSDAVENAKTLFHSPTISSIEDSKIVSRVMVLREFNLKKRFMRFHTDYRAPKIEQYKKNSTATVLGYDPILKVQIKLQGRIESHYDNSVTRNAWDGSTTRSKKCYSVRGGSSSRIDNPNEYDLKDGNLEDGYMNFAVLIFQFDSLEFLHLKSSGHRRAIHSWDDTYKSSWLVP
ncbi:MAG: pyridoxamine 5'-phosphate oxidase [Flavobacteriales bacterium]|nr:pyridoxamine 5'-phosphate oxidase [Flavobacteriales bacterium]|tara:strand:- start:5079 stop:5684 length:606 start_codon:yes stop_codon:yes gene_type:complete